MATVKIDYTNCYSQTVNNALSHLEGAPTASQSYWQPKQSLRMS